MPKPAWTEKRGAYPVPPSARSCLWPHSGTDRPSAAPGQPCLSVDIGLEIRAVPSGLAASIAPGNIPPWLEPLALGDTPYEVYAVQRDAVGE